MHFKILKIHFKNAMKYPAKNPAKFLKPEPEPEPDIRPDPDSAGYPVGSYKCHSPKSLLPLHFSTDINLHKIGQMPLWRMNIKLA